MGREKSTFFCSNNNLLSDATMSLRGSHIKEETAADRNRPSGVSFRSVLPRQRSANEGRAYLFWENGSISFSHCLPWCLFSCLFLAFVHPTLVPAPLFIKKKEKERGKGCEHSAISWSCSGGFGKNSKSADAERYDNLAHERFWVVPRILGSNILWRPVISPAFPRWLQVFQALLQQFSCFFF